MRKIKRLLLVLLSCFCIFAFSGCSIVLGTVLVSKWVADLAKEDKATKTEGGLPFEIVEDFSIVNVCENTAYGDVRYDATVRAVVKNLGDKDAYEFGFTLFFYNEKGGLIQSVDAEFPYVGKGEAMVCEVKKTISAEPMSVKAKNAVLREGELNAARRDRILIGQETFACVRNEEDGKYHATVSGRMEGAYSGQESASEAVMVEVIFYGANGYTYYSKDSLGLEYGETYDYVVKWIGDTEIVSYKILNK